jgi:DNA primase
VTGEGSPAVAKVIRSRGFRVPTSGSGDFKQQVLAASDIVEVIGRSVALKRRGKDFVGLCPFHQEKSPSFAVSPHKQMFFCYGCKAGGDVFKFVMLRDRVEFKEALHSLAQSANIEIPQFGGNGGKEKAGERQLLFDAHSQACAFFEKLLADANCGRAAREYLAGRGFDEAVVKRFQIGLAPDAWDGLLRGPVGKKFAPQLLLTGGLLKSRENGGGFYDVFRNRLMFPIRDEQNRVIAFGGRKLKEEEQPKYLNSPETPLFSKSRCLFGLDAARQRVVETRTAVVVEGYTDVVMAHQYGATNVVSPLGTALTDQHVAILRRFADRIVLLFDADTAGDVAVDRAVGLFLTQPIEIAIASMPPDVDPDEFLLKEGLDAWNKLIAAAPDALTYKTKLFDREYQRAAGDMTARQRATERFIDALASARGGAPIDPMRWHAALSRVSKISEIPLAELKRQLAAKAKPAPMSAARQPAARSEPAEIVPQPAPTYILPRALTGRLRAELRILGILLLNPNLWHGVQRNVGVTDFTDPAYRALADVYWDHQRNEGEPDMGEFLGALTDPTLRELAVAATDEVESLPEQDRVLAEAIAYLEEQRKAAEEQKLMAQLRRGTEERLPEQAEVDLLKQLQDKARQPNLRRA